MVFLIAMVLLIGLFLYSSVGTACFIGAAVVLIFGLKKGLSAEKGAASGRMLILTVAATAALVGLGIFLHDLSFTALLFP